MVTSDISLLSGLNFQVECQDRLRINLDTNEAVTKFDSRSEWGACLQLSYFNKICLNTFS